MITTWVEEGGEAKEGVSRGAQPPETKIVATIEGYDRRRSKR